MQETDWKHPPQRIKIMETDVHLWQIPLDHPKVNPGFRNLVLSKQERERAQRFHFDQDRRRFMNAHVALRIILATYVQINPQLIEYQFNAFGKPSLAGREENGLSFNLTHSHELALVAIAKNQPIGIDLEFIRPLQNLEALARQCFSTAEHQQFSEIPAPENLSAFYYAWTRKEAFIKAIGDGLTYPLDQFDVTIMPGESAKIKSISENPREAKNWILQDIQTLTGYVASFAVKLEKANIRRWIYQYEDAKLATISRN